MSFITSTEELGDLVTQTRKSQRLTQGELAASVGVGIRFLQELERGKESCHIGKTLEVLAMLGLSIAISPENTPTDAPITRPKAATPAETLSRDILEAMLAASDTTIRFVGLGRDDTPFTTEEPIATHLLKAPDPARAFLPENEFFCSQLAKRLKIPVVTTDLRRAMRISYLLATRFDHIKAKDGSVTQFPLEIKDGDIDLRRNLAIIRATSSQPAADLRHFIRLTLFNTVIGNDDASWGSKLVFIIKDSKKILAPAHDLICSAAYTNNDAPMMPYNEWLSLAANTKTAQSDMGTLMNDILGNITNEAVALRDHLDDHGIYSPVFETIIDVITKRTNDMK